MARVVAFLLASACTVSFAMRKRAGVIMQLKHNASNNGTHNASHRSSSEVTHIAGIPLRNHIDLLWEGRADFLRTVKHELVEGREHWIISMKKGLTMAQFDNDANRKGVELKGAPNTVPFLEYKGTTEELEVYLKEIGQDVDHVEPDLPVHAADLGLVDEREPVRLGNLKSKGMSAKTDICLPNMNILGRSQRTKTGTGVHVYVLDTGIRVSHQEFNRADSVFMIQCSSGGQCGWIDCATNPSFREQCDSDLNGHGTHCAGSVAGIQLGVAPHAHVHAVKILGADGSGSLSWVMAGVNYVVEKGQKPAVMSMSIGAQKSGTSETALEAAVRTAINDHGIKVVVAAGNENQNACNSIPASVGQAITVGSMKLNYNTFEPSEQESGFSNFGTCVDILAPGERIWSAYPGSDSQIAALTGTSMACPHVAGVVAMILENGDLSPTEVLAELQANFSVRNTINSLKPNTPNLRLAIGPQSDPPCEASAQGQRGLAAGLFLALLAVRYF